MGNKLLFLLEIGLKYLVSNENAPDLVVLPDKNTIIFRGGCKSGAVPGGFTGQSSISSTVLLDLSVAASFLLL